VAAAARQPYDTIRARVTCGSGVTGASDRHRAFTEAPRGRGCPSALPGCLPRGRTGQEPERGPGTCLRGVLVPHRPPHPGSAGERPDSGVSAERGDDAVPLPTYRQRLLNMIGRRGRHSREGGAW
jgi:hypothetical protein